MELNEMEKRLIFQTEGYGKSDVTYELRMCLPYIPDPVRRKTAAELVRKLDAMPEKDCLALIQDIRKNYRIPAGPKTMGELLAEARQKSGAEKLKGHDIMALERFDPEVKHMIVFDVLSGNAPVGDKGDKMRLFLTDAGYQKFLDSQERGEVKLKNHAKVAPGGHLHYDRKDRAFSIVGIYEIKEPQLNAGLVPPPSLYQNRIFIDDSNGESGEYQRLEFYVKDPAQLSNTIESAKENANIAWDDFAVETADEEYQRTAAPLENMSVLVSSLLICLIIGSALVLSLILSLWIKGRIHETGILLAMGYRKTQIFLQHFAEVMMIAVLAFGISFFAGQVVADVTGDLLLQNVSAQTETIASDTASSLEVEITVRNFAAVCGIGTLVVAFSVGMSNIPVFRLQPKEILSKMS